MIISMINFQIYKTHIKLIKPQKPALIKPEKNSWVRLYDKTRDLCQPFMYNEDE